MAAKDTIANWRNALKNAITVRGVNTEKLEDTNFTPKTKRQLEDIVVDLEKKTGTLYEKLYRRGGRKNGQAFMDELLSFLRGLLAEQDSNAVLNDMKFSKDKTFGEEMPAGEDLEAWVKENAQTIYDSFLLDNPNALLNALPYIADNITDGIALFKDSIEERVDKFKSAVEEIREHTSDEQDKLINLFLETGLIEDVTYSTFDDRRIMNKISGVNVNTSDLQTIQALKIAYKIGEFISDYKLKEFKSHGDIVALHNVLKAKDGVTLFTSIGRMFTAKTDLRSPQDRKKIKRGKRRGVGPDITRDTNIRDWVVRRARNKKGDEDPYYTDENGTPIPIPDDTIDREDEIKFNKYVDYLVKQVKTEGSSIRNNYLDSMRVEITDIGENKHIKDLGAVKGTFAQLIILHYIEETRGEDEPLHKIPDDFILIREDTVKGEADKLRNIVIILRKLDENLIAGKIVELLVDSTEGLGETSREVISNLTENSDKINNYGKELERLLSKALLEIRTLVAINLNRALEALTPTMVYGPKKVLPKIGGKWVDEILDNSMFIDAEGLDDAIKNRKG